MSETNQSLKTHVNLKHGNENEKDEESDGGNTFIESFKCDECEFMANTKQNWKTHVDLKHGKKMRMIKLLKLNWNCLLSTLVMMCMKTKIIFWKSSMNRKKLKTYSHIHIVKKQMISLHVHSAKSYPTQSQSAKLFLVSEYAKDYSKHGS